MLFALNEKKKNYLCFSYMLWYKKVDDRFAITWHDLVQTLKEMNTRKELMDFLKTLLATAMVSTSGYVLKLTEIP